MGTTATKEEQLPHDGKDDLTAELDQEVDLAEFQAPLGSPARRPTMPIGIPTGRDKDGPTLDAWVGSNPHGSVPQNNQNNQNNQNFRTATKIATTHENDVDMLQGQTLRPRTHKVTFKWTGSANTVAVAGSFNNWQNPIVLKKRGHNEFWTELELDLNEHEYKYIVDGTWKHDPLAPVIACGLGSLNNILKLDEKYSDDPTVGIENFGETDSAFGRNTPPGDYAQKIPNFEERDEPPMLPPHLKEATLNCEPSVSDDPSDLPVPNHVVLDHLYAQSVKDNVLVLGATHRYKRKYVTTVLYKPLSTVVT